MKIIADVTVYQKVLRMGDEYIRSQFNGDERYTNQITWYECEKVDNGVEVTQPVSLQFAIVLEDEFQREFYKHADNG